MTDQGLSLADIGRLHKDVPVGDSFVRVYGISAATALDLLNRYPEALTKAMGGKFGEMIKTAPHVIGAILAAGVGKAGDAEAEAAAQGVPIEVQMDILEAIGGLTFTKGFGPFVKRITDLANAATAGSASFGKVPDTQSPPASKS